MKRTNKFITQLGFFLLMGSLLVACGKDNKSGQGGLSQWGINGLGVGVGQYGQIDLSQISHPVVIAAINENVCIGSNGGSAYPTAVTNQGVRYGVQFPLTGQTGMVAGDYYLGVTSFGDVAVVVGQGPSQPPIFIAYLCNRGGIGGQGQLARAPQFMTSGPYCGSAIKPMNATLALPSAFGQDGALFRWADGGASTGAKFSFCTGRM